jgi:O-antigen/teichoic acid export membrane protein
MDLQTVNRHPIRSGLGNTLFTNIAFLVLGLVSGGLLARLLGVVGRGEFAQILFLPQLIVSLGSFSIADLLVHRTARKKLSLTPVRALAMRALVVAMVATLLLGVPLCIWFYRAYPIHIMHLAIVYLVAYCLPYFGSALLNSYDQAALQFRRWNAIRLLVPITFVGGLLILYVLDISQLSIVIAVSLISTWVSLIGRLAIDSGLTLGHARWIHAFLYLRNAGRLHLPVAASLLLSQAERFFVIALLPTFDLGLYAVAWSYGVGISGSLFLAINAVALPRISRLFKSEEQMAVIGQLISVSALLAAGLVVLLYILAPLLIIGVFGAAFSDSVPIAQVLLVGGYFVGLRQIVTRAVKIGHIPKFAFVAEIASFVPFAALVVPATTIFGLAGLVWASAIGAFLGLLTLAIMLRVYEGVPLLSWIGFRPKVVHLVLGLLRNPRL